MVASDTSDKVVSSDIYFWVGQKREELYGNSVMSAFFLIWVISNKVLYTCFWYIIIKFCLEFCQYDIFVYVIISLYDKVNFLFISRNFFKGDNFIRDDKFLKIDNLSGNLLLSRFKVLSSLTFLSLSIHVFNILNCFGDFLISLSSISVDDL